MEALNNKIEKLISDLNIKFCEKCNKNYTLHKCHGCKKYLCKNCGKNNKVVRNIKYFSCNEQCAKNAYKSRKNYKKE